MTTGLSARWNSKARPVHDFWICYFRELGVQHGFDVGGNVLTEHEETLLGQHIKHRVSSYKALHDWLGVRFEDCLVVFRWSSLPAAPNAFSIALVSVW